MDKKLGLGLTFLVAGSMAMGACKPKEPIVELNTYKAPTFCTVEKLEYEITRGITGCGDRIKTSDIEFKVGIDREDGNYVEVKIMSGRPIYCDLPFESVIRHGGAAGSLDDNVIDYYSDTIENGETYEIFREQHSGGHFEPFWEEAQEKYDLAIQEIGDTVKTECEYLGVDIPGLAKGEQLCAEQQKIEEVQSALETEVLDNEEVDLIDVEISKEDNICSVDELRYDAQGFITRKLTFDVAIDAEKRPYVDVTIIEVDPVTHNLISYGYTHGSRYGSMEDNDLDLLMINTDGEYLFVTREDLAPYHPPLFDLGELRYADAVKELGEIVKSECEYMGIDIPGIDF